MVSQGRHETLYHIPQSFNLFSFSHVDISQLIYIDLSMNKMKLEVGSMACKLFQNFHPHINMFSYEGRIFICVWNNFIRGWNFQTLMKYWYEDENFIRRWNPFSAAWIYCNIYHVLKRDAKCFKSPVYWQIYNPKAPLRQYIANPISTVIPPVFYPLRAPSTQMQPIWPLFNLHADEAEGVNTRLTAWKATDIVQYFRSKKINQPWLWSNILKVTKTSLKILLITSFIFLVHNKHTRN